MEESNGFSPNKDGQEWYHGKEREHVIFDEDQILGALVERKKAKMGKKNEKVRKKKSNKSKTSTTKSMIGPFEVDDQDNQVEMVEDSDRDIYDETKSSWELGKSLGLYAENDNLVIETLIGVLKSKSDHLK